MRQIIATIIISTAAVVSIYGANNVLNGIDLVDIDGNAVVRQDIATPLILLYLNDPECDVCHAVSDSIDSSEIISKAVADKLITILSVYPGDNVQLWKKSAAAHKDRKECINPSMNIFESRNISFSYLPALFVLDNSGNLLLDNSGIKTIENYLKDINTYCNKPD